MKTKLLAASLIAATVLTVAVSGAFQNTIVSPTPISGLPPVIQPGNESPRIEVAFVLDTTGSMGGLIETAKRKIWSVARTMATAQPAPEIRMGLVAYRDRGDEYVTQVSDLSTDLDAIYGELLTLRAAGGGDGPESVNQALQAALQSLSWTAEPNTYRVVFLVGDAPPHMDYPNDIGYPQLLADARTRGIVINTIQCGNEVETTEVWQDIAQLGGGHYAQVQQDGGAVALNSPYDDTLARLSADLDATRLYYGSKEDRQKGERRKQASEALRLLAPTAALAGRAEFNASPSGASNFAGEGELLRDLKNGDVELDALDEEQLPEVLQSLAPEQRLAEVHEIAQKRAELEARIDDISRQRSDFLRAQVAEMGGAEDSLDDQIYGAIREQSAASGLRYSEETPRY